MNRVLASTAVGLAVVVGVLLNMQQVVTADPAIVIKNDGECGMPGSDEEGNLTFGGLGVQITAIENDNKVMLKCKGTDIANPSGQAQVYEGFECGVFAPSGDLVITFDSHATVSAKGIGTMTCTYDK